MECKKCGYRLWNIQSRQCPECGEGFTPSDYDFVPGTVAYCCPHCEQTYFGTDHRGHLQPQAFTCVNCQQPVDMAQMVLRPAAGYEELQTRATDNPWVKRDTKKSTVLAWLRVCLRALVRPSDLVSRHVEGDYAISAWFFLFFNFAMLSLLAAGPFVAMGVFSSFDDHDFLPAILTFLGVLLGVVTVGFVLLLLAVGVWGGITHGVLKIISRPACLFTDTVDCFCYGSGTGSLMAIPFVGPFLFGWLFVIWWPVSAGLILARMHHVSRIRAIFAACMLPLLLFLGTVGAGAYQMYTYSAMTFGMTMPVSTLNIGDMILKHVNEDGTIGPDHILRLLMKNDEYKSNDSSYSSYSNWENDLADNTPNGWRDGFQEGCNDLSMALRYLNDSDPKEQKRAQLYLDQIKAALDGMQPLQGPGYRFGNMLFLYNKVHKDKINPNLWLVVNWPKNTTPDDYAIFKGDGTEERMDYVSLVDGVIKQDALRRELGLPEIQSLDSIRIVPLAVTMTNFYDDTEPDKLDVVKQILASKQANGQIGPDHILRTLLDQKLESEPFSDFDPSAGGAAAPQFPTNWHGNWPANTTEAKKQTLVNELDKLPKRKGAGYRFGQLLLVYDGITEDKLDPELWLAIRWPKNYSPEQTRIYKADGGIVHVFKEDIPRMLDAQDALRQKLGVPRIGPLEKIQEITLEIPHVNECECEKEANEKKPDQQEKSEQPNPASSVE